MNHFKLILSIVTSVLFFSCEAKIKNGKTETAHINGNCEMCEQTIEKAGSIKNISSVDWDKTSKKASITYNPKKTTLNEVLKRIALAGYDNQEYLAPDESYAALASCCQYERSGKREMHHISANTTKIDNTNIKAQEPQEKILAKDSLKTFFNSYFALKDALITSNSKEVSDKARDLLSIATKLDEGKLTEVEHNVWIAMVDKIKKDAEQMSKASDIEAQRQIFMNLTKNVYALRKISKQETAVYFQHCPMYNNGVGADWLSKEKTIKNPYYGSQMLTCGKVVETISK